MSGDAAVAAALRDIQARAQHIRIRPGSCPSERRKLLHARLPRRLAGHFSLLTIKPFTFCTDGAIGKKFALVKGVKRLKKPITLTKLPTGTYKISILATTVLKQRLSGSQTYKSCTAGSGKIGLKDGKKHHHHG